MGLLQETLHAIKGADQDALRRAKDHIDNLAKPPGSLGVLEEIGARIAGITGQVMNKITKKNIVILCSDNGICEEGISSSDQSFTATMARMMPQMRTGVGVLAAHAGSELTVVDMGILVDPGNPKVINRRIGPGTANMSKGPAMSREDAIKAIEIGIEIADGLFASGVDLMGTGEMGIGNTSTSAAVIAALLGRPVEELAGLGAGLTPEQLDHKRLILRKAITINCPDSEDVVDVLSKVGGFDIAGLCGCFLSAAKNRKPIVIDGVISCAAALCAYRLDPRTADYMFASHKSEERAVEAVFETLGLKPVLYLNMRLGEGSGCPLAFQIIEAAMAMVNNMATFEDVGIAMEHRERVVDIRKI